MPNGRFAPSPTGPLHLGNLRTALVAWLFARSTHSSFIVRMEDLDTVSSSRHHADSQLRDLAALGLDWDGDVVFQSDRFELYRDAISSLRERDLVYECWCTRREIQEASQAPNRPELPDGAYPGTCRSLSESKKAAKRSDGRSPALRLRSDNTSRTFIDAIQGVTTAFVDDVVLARADGVPAYNLAVVVDDDLQGIAQVVRGDDLLTSTPRQIALGELLGFKQQTYAHIPLALNDNGKRLAKRDGAVTLDDQRGLGRPPQQVVAILGATLGLCNETDDLDAKDLVGRFANVNLPTTPWVMSEALHRRG